MSELLPLGPLFGGALIGASASILLLFEGQVAGISGIFAAAVGDPRQNLRWRVPFLVGLVLTGLVLGLASPPLFGAASPSRAVLPLALAGLLVGFGTRLGSGCTSGHGVSGLSRLSRRSLVATLTFIAAGMITTYALRHVGGPS